MYVLGISAFYHDSSAALIRDGIPVSAAQEERFSRLKQDHRFPAKSVEYCLASENLTFDDIDYIVFYEKPFLKFERIVQTHLSFAPAGFQLFKKAIPLWASHKLFQKKVLIRELEKLGAEGDINTKILFSEHHQSHSASAFFPSPFDEAAVLTVDGVGEWTTTSISVGNGPNISIIKEIHFPHSLGLFYSAFTHFCGFRVNSGEYKLMGLAPYGEPKFRKSILDHIIEIKPDGSFELNLDFFDFCTGLEMTSNKFSEHFKIDRRLPTEKITPEFMNIAASVQKVLEEAMINLSKEAIKYSTTGNLCLAGGVALNCVANAKIMRIPTLNNLWIQPAAGDAGGSLGAALGAYYSLERERKLESESSDSMSNAYLGPSYKNEYIRNILDKNEAVYTEYENSELVLIVAKKLENGDAIGWFQGRMEFGPRALGNRSIIADPRSKSMQRDLNLKVKFRESFRPFAPVIMEEHVEEWFENVKKSPYMLLTTKVNECVGSVNSSSENILGFDKLKSINSKIPAVTHVDMSARVQTVSKESNKLLHALLEAFYELTGCPILINTSFNVRGEPIVCTPDDAFRNFMGAHLDTLVIGNYVLEKTAQTTEFDENFKHVFEAD